MLEFKLRKAGNSVVATIPKEILGQLNVKEGDTLFGIQTRDGVLLTPYDPEMAEYMEIARGIMARDRDALRELAK
ncbi:AbrB/MazE/SpoVT family DNA-binding domain-containing protein [Hoeflea poritis]|uniref:AbrB/MazE/SpoVT family DNA-binding domain-containing protein n=1 Tax=Hoeflea poritis TaxID=2993659 RepID=A0ABT4VR41_9HYPH|nr:AbrB/MazE/SpoVT family DNA-binding domain-containing protein [Hoeflea poritis]MDA4846645.1 AbrB/MazE/SpoVT family DNA-binding domain-containing protein [Hoeflea poritis]